MAAQSCGIKVDTHSIFQHATHMGITKKGELFSSSAVCALATHIKIHSVLLSNGFSDIQLLLRYFTSGKLLLVPYDLTFILFVFTKIIEVGIKIIQF
jgi:hypothetical protein